MQAAHQIMAMSSLRLSCSGTEMVTLNPFLCFSTVARTCDRASPHDLPFRHTYHFTLYQMMNSTAVSGASESICAGLILC